MKETKPHRAAVIQLNSTEDTDRNFHLAQELFREALSLRANFVSFPENMLLMTGDKNHLKYEAKNIKQWISRFATWAKDAKVFLHTGTLPMEAPRSQKLLNTSLIFSPKGKIIAKYSKIHLFDAEISGDRSYRESKTIQAGTKIVSCKTSLGRVGLSVCYDVRFPELYRSLAKSGSDILLIPAAFTVPTGQAHWDVLTRARAIENLCYVLAAAQCGANTSERKTYGHSRIIDPWGTVLAESKGDASCCLVAEINRSHLQEFRRKMPALKHRRIFKC